MAQWFQAKRGLEIDPESLGLCLLLSTALLNAEAATPGNSAGFSTANICSQSLVHKEGSNTPISICLSIDLYTAFKP